MGLFSFLGKKDPKQKYVGIFLNARKIGLSVETALRQAVDAAVADKVYPDRKAAAEELFKAVITLVDKDDKSELEKAKRKAAL
ncbi:MAG: hypothetical protein IMX00_01360 [Limnochordales bacterium]|nr:hypothetical protein [Limnochordales bacterium]